MMQYVFLAEAEGRVVTANPRGRNSMEIIEQHGTHSVNLLEGSRFIGRADITSKEKDIAMLLGFKELVRLGRIRLPCDIPPGTRISIHDRPYNRQIIVCNCLHLILFPWMEARLLRMADGTDKWVGVLRNYDGGNEIRSFPAVYTTPWEAIINHCGRLLMRDGIWR